MLSPTPPLTRAAATLTPGWTSEASLRGRRHLFWRRRLALRLRAWMGIAAIVCFSMTLFVVTFFSLIGR